VPTIVGGQAVMQRQTLRAAVPTVFEVYLSSDLLTSDVLVWLIDKRTGRVRCVPCERRA
jgi:hypothetical protein